MRGRPKVNPEDKKDRLVQIKFSIIDKTRLKERAKREHITITALIRKWVLEALNGSGKG